MSGEVLSNAAFFLGMSNPWIQALLERLPGAHCCHKYVFRTAVPAPAPQGSFPLPLVLSCVCAYAYT